MFTLGETMKLNNIHIKLSIFCYLLCLALPAFYTTEYLEPKMSFVALMVGWLGPIVGHFSWYANPIFLRALFLKDQPKKSSILGFIALALAISFLFYSKIAVSEAPTYEQITAYGWGYGLWITSLAVFSIGQLLREQGVKNGHIINVSFIVCGFLIAIYATYYFGGDNSLSATYTKRKQEFQSRCATAGEEIFKRADDVRGIFYDPDWEMRLSPKDNKPNSYYISGGGVLGLRDLNSGRLLFYETRDKDDRNSFRRYILGDHKGVQTYDLDSEYAVITKYYKIPPRLNITGATITIKDLRDDSIMATTTFFIENESGKFCGNSRGGSPTSSLVTEVLNLSEKYSSTVKR